MFLFTVAEGEDCEQQAEHLNAMLASCAAESPAKVYISCYAMSDAVTSLVADATCQDTQAAISAALRAAVRPTASKANNDDGSAGSDGNDGAGVSSKDDEDQVLCFISPKFLRGKSKGICNDTSARLNAALELHVQGEFSSCVLTTPTTTPTTTTTPSTTPTTTTTPTTPTTTTTATTTATTTPTTTPHVPRFECTTIKGLTPSLIAVKGSTPCEPQAAFLNSLADQCRATSYTKGPGVALGRNACNVDSDYCCDCDCTHCGPVDYCRSHSPFQSDCGVCRPTYSITVITCDSFTCPEGYLQRANPESRPGEDRATCCYKEGVCAGQAVGSACSLGDIGASFIPNPSFEEHSGCPTSFTQLSFANTWLQATGATSDYWIGAPTCTDSWKVGIGGIGGMPQKASDGDAFVGSIKSGAPYFEYVGACLKSPLLSGVNYTLTMDMNAATTSGSYGGDTNGDTELLCVSTCSALPASGTGWMGGTFPVLAAASPGGGLQGGGAWKALTFSFTPSVDCPAIMFGPAQTQSVQPGETGNYVMYDALNLQDGSAGECDARGECVESSDVCQNHYVSDAETKIQCLDISEKSDGGNGYLFEVAGIDACRSTAAALNAAILKTTGEEGQITCAFGPTNTPVLKALSCPLAPTQLNVAVGIDKDGRFEGCDLLTTTAAPTTQAACFMNRFGRPLMRHRGRSTFRLSNTEVGSVEECAVECNANVDCFAFSVRTDTIPLRCWQQSVRDTVVGTHIEAYDAYLHYAEDSSCMTTTTSSTATSETTTTVSTTTASTTSMSTTTVTITSTTTSATTTSASSTSATSTSATTTTSTTSVSSSTATATSTTTQTTATLTTTTSTTTVTGTTTTATSTSKTQTSTSVTATSTTKTTTTRVPIQGALSCTFQGSTQSSGASTSTNKGIVGVTLDTCSQHLDVVDQIVAQCQQQLGLNLPTSMSLGCEHPSQPNRLATVGSPEGCHTVADALNAILKQIGNGVAGSFVCTFTGRLASTACAADLIRINNAITSFEEHNFKCTSNSNPATAPITTAPAITATTPSTVHQTPSTPAQQVAMLSCDQYEFAGGQGLVTVNDPSECAHQTAFLDGMFDVCSLLNNDFVPPQDMLTCFEAPGATFAVLGEFNARCSSIASRVNSVVANHDGGLSPGFQCTIDGLLITPRTCTESTESVSRLNGAVDAYLTGEFDCTSTTQAPTQLTTTHRTTTATETTATATSQTLTTTSSTTSTLTTATLTTTTSSTTVTFTTETATVPAACIANSNLFELQNGTSTTAPVDDDDGEDEQQRSNGFCFSINPVRGGVRVKCAPTAGSSFKYSTIASVRSQMPGYLYARAASSGFRFSGLYVRSRNRGLIFFYKAVGSTAQKSVMFAFSTLGDEAQHAIELSVDGVTAVLSVDSIVIGTRLLDGFVDDCGVPGPECITHVGQRYRGFTLTGCLSAASLEPAAPTPFDLLNPAFHDRAVAPGIDDGAYCFERGSTPGLKLHHFPASSTTFSILVAFNVAKGASGYLIAKGAAGKSRYFSLYIRRSDQRVVMYYRSLGSTQQKSAILTTSSVVGDNTLRVSVQEGVVQALLITSEGAKEATTVVLDGPVDDCSQPGKDCTMHVGQRNGGLLLSNGCIFTAHLLPGRA